MTTGQYIQPTPSIVLPDVIDDIDLDQLFQDAVVQITGLPGTLVFERFQNDPNAVVRRPESTVNWCAIAVTTSESDDSPVIEPVDDPTQVKYSDHEGIEVLASFYGPNSGRYAGLFRDGIKIPQNMEALQSNNIFFQEAQRIVRVPELVNQQWQMRRDLSLTFRRKIERLYPVGRFTVVQLHIRDDHPENKAVFDATVSIDLTNPPP